MGHMIQVATQVLLIFMFGAMLFQFLEAESLPVQINSYRSSYATFYPGYTGEPLEEQVWHPRPTNHSVSKYKQPILGFVPDYVAIMSLSILLVGMSGFLVLYLYSNKILR